MTQTASMVDRLIEAAQADARSIRTVTRCDGTTYQAPKNFGSAIENGFQVYVVPVGRRISSRQDHYRATFYVLRDGAYKRVNRAEFERLALA